MLAPLDDERQNELCRRMSEGTGSEERRDGGARGRYRTPAQRDCDRILYSSAFHRLASVTQVTASESGHTFHNRLGHSLKVAQIGRRNAERLRWLAEQKQLTGAAARLIEAVDPDAVQAACLAHDLGHPPFGHIAEHVLGDLAREHVSDGFEGNAQSFRIVTNLAVRDDARGLDLTRGVLNGILKYPWRYRPSDPVDGGVRERKWGYYEEDEDAYEFARAGWPDDTLDELPERSFEAELMDWADDLTYALHDMDDFYRAGLVPLDQLAQGADELKRFEQLLYEARDAAPRAFPSLEIPEIVQTVHRICSLEGPLASYHHTRDLRALMREFGSKLITRYLEAFQVENGPGDDEVLLKIDEGVRREVDALKLLVGVYVIRRPGLAVVQHGQTKVIADLFGWYYDASPAGANGDRRLFPPGARERLEKAGNSPHQRARVVIDLISGLTESSAIQLHRRLSGGWTAPTLDATAVMG